MKPWQVAVDQKQRTRSEYTERATGGEFIDPDVEAILQRFKDYQFTAEDPTCAICKDKNARCTTGYLYDIGAMWICSSKKCRKLYKTFSTTMRKHQDRGVK